MSERLGRGDAGLAEDLLPLADRREVGAPVPWVALGDIVLEAERLREHGTLSPAAFASLRRRARGLVASLPGYRQAEALMSLDALDPSRSSGS
jgi:hypothetical protein